MRKFTKYLNCCSLAIIIFSYLAGCSSGGDGNGGDNNPEVPSSGLSPIISSFSALPEPVISKWASVILLPEFTNGTGEIDQGVGAVPPGLNVIVTPQETTTYTLTVTSSEGNIVTQNITVEVRTTSTLQYPSMVSAGYNHSCALDSTGVVCWGNNRYGQTSPPSLSNPTHISAGYLATCVLDDSGVVCWGNNAFGQTNVPALSNPKTVVMSQTDFFACALDDTGVVCWGDNIAGQQTCPI